MSIKINLREPNGKNMAKLLHALAEYIETDQTIDVYINLGFIEAEEDDEKLTDSILFAKSGSTWNTELSISSYPLRAYELIEFFKTCQEKQEIIGIEIDIEDHSISFMFQTKEK